MVNYTNEELCLIWLDSFLGLENKHKQQLYKMISGRADIKKLIEASRDYIITEISESVYEKIRSSANSYYLDFLLEGLKKRGVRAVTITSDSYPESLKNVPVPPLVLYCKGDEGLLKTRCFGIVGSRKSLPMSVNLAKEYVKTVVSAGFTPVTGIAQGVDGVVLESALGCGGRPISVVAGGLDNVYPKSNQSLLEKVMDKGLAVSESPPEVTPLPFLFPLRNRIIAGLSEGVLIVSGGIKSGTLYTAEYAVEFGKDVFVIPFSPNVSSGAGCNDLLKRSREIMLTDRPSDITDYYGIASAPPEKEVLTETEKRIMKALSDGAVHIDKLCGVVGMRVYEITPVLSMLEIKGYVVKNGVNVYGAAKILEE